VAPDCIRATVLLPLASGALPHLSPLSGVNRCNPCPKWVD